MASHLSISTHGLGGMVTLIINKAVISQPKCMHAVPAHVHTCTASERDPMRSGERDVMRRGSPTVNRKSKRGNYLYRFDSLRERSGSCPESSPSQFLSIGTTRDSRWK